MYKAERAMSAHPRHADAEQSIKGEDLVAEGLLTIAAAAEFLSISRSKLYEMMDEGELQFVKIGRSRRVPRRAVTELAARGLQGGSKVA